MRTVHLLVRKSLLLCAAVFLAITPALAQTQPTLSPELRSGVDDIAQQVLKTTGVPSASVAVVQDGKIAYVQAYGSARLDPQMAATPAMRYSIGSISKQFTAAAVLMLVQEGKLSLDDPVSKYIPGLTEGDKISIRELLSHTSGYQDYFPQDYVPPLMLGTAIASPHDLRSQSSNHADNIFTARQIDSRRRECFLYKIARRLYLVSSSAF